MGRNLCNSPLEFSVFGDRDLLLLRAALQTEIGRTEKSKVIAEARTPHRSRAGISPKTWIDLSARSATINE